MNQLRKRIGIIWLCLSVAFAIMPYNPVYAEEAREESLAEATQEEKDNEEAKEEKEENQNQQEDDEDTGNADADSDKDLDAESDADEASEEATEESENPEDLGNESEAEEKEDVQQEPEAEEAFDEVSEEAAESIIISFYVPKDAEGEYELFKKMAADEDGKVIFPDADDLPEIEGLYFAGEWQDEEFNSVDEDMIFEESCKLYAVFEEDELSLISAPIMRAPAQRASSYGIDANNPRRGQKNSYEYKGSVETWICPMTGIYDIYCYGAAGTTGEGGAMRASRAEITKGTILKITVGGKPPAYSYGGSLGEGHTKSNTSCSYADIQKTADGTVIGQDMDIYQYPKYGNSSTHWGIGSGRRYRGYPDGGWGDFEASPCDNGNHTNQASVGYGGGGSSFVSIGSTKVISGKGGYGGGASNERICGSNKGGTAKAGVGGGVTCLNSARGLKWLTSELNLVQGAPDANGSITITVVKVNPGVTLVQDIADWTNQLITITATVTSVGEGLPAEYLSWETDADGNDIWTDSTTYLASQNGTYTCKIRDVAGNIEKASIEITNIDRLLPEGELLPDTEEWTRDDIELTLNADDAAASPEDGKSGLEDKAYLWGTADSDGALLWEMDADGNEAWTDATTYVASQNGTYACQIRDKAGNISEERIKVTNIDRTAPEIKAEHPTWYSGETTVSWQGLDLQPDGTPGSGLHSEAYSFDGVDWTAENTQQITAPGTYTIYVRDAVENVGRYEIELLYDPEPEDDKGGGKGGNNPQPVVNPPEQPELPEQPKEDTSGDGRNGNLIPQLPLPKEPVKAEIFELAVQEPEVEPELKLPHSPKVKKKNADTMMEIVVDSPYAEGAGHEKLLQAAVMTGAATSGGIILYFALFFIIPAARIYELRGKRRKYLGTKLLLRRKVDLRKLFEKTEESSLMIKINWLYAKYNAGKKLSCIKGQDIEEKDVQVTMIVYR